MNGILTLINTYTLKIINRDFEEQNLNLIRNDKLEFEIINVGNTELDFNLSVFMRYVIKRSNIYSNWNDSRIKSTNYPFSLWKITK